MKRKVSISIGGLQGKYGDMRAIEIAKEIGADAVDFNVNRYDLRDEKTIYSKSDEEIIQYFSDLKKRADELGIEIAQTHGRMKGFINDKEEDDMLVKNARLDCLATSILGAPVCVIHAVTSIFMGADPDRKLMHDLNADMFCRMLEFAKEYKVKIATETFGDAVVYGCCDFFGNINEFIMSYNRVCAIGDNADWFCVCVDTGHSNKAMRYSNPTPADVIRMLGKNITVLHLNDNDTFTDQHKIPMSGTIDWKDVFDALDEVGYNGIYNMEISLNHFGKDFQIEEAAFAIKVMKNILKDRYGE